VWDLATGARLLTLAAHTVGVRDVAFSPDGTRLATAGFDGLGRLWDAGTGAPLAELVGHEGLVVGVSFSPDGARVATAGTEGTARVWDASTGALLFAVESGTEGIVDVAFSPDGRLLATASADVRLWDAASGAEVRRLAGHSAGVWSVAFSPDGARLASGSADGTAKVWDTATGALLQTLPAGGEVRSVAFSPTDGGAHLAVTSDGVVRLYRLRLEDLLGLAQTRVVRAFTEEECQRFLHLEACPPGPP
jgi:WD40 repeat protein